MGTKLRFEQLEDIIALTDSSRVIANILVAAHYTGFPNRVDTSLGWDDGTYTLTLTATSDTIWIYGVPYVINTLTKQLSAPQEAASGTYWFWLTESGGVVSLNADTVHPGWDVCLVASVYWNTTTSKGVLGDERHWMGRDKQVHEYLHETTGARYALGLTGTFADTTLEVTSGEFYDEDIEHLCSADSPMTHPGTAMTVCKVLFHNGDADWDWDAASTTPYKVVGGGDNNLRYNNGTALATAGLNRYVNYWVFVTSDVDTPIHIALGTAEYVTLAGAREATLPALGELATPEAKIIYKITYQNLVTGPDYIETTDYRSVSSLPTGNFVPTEHSTLTGLDHDDHAQYWISGTLRTGDFSTSGDVTGDVVSGTTIISAGIDDNTIGILRSYGGTGVGVIGGNLHLYLHASHDSVFEYYKILPYEDDLYFRTSTDVDYLILKGAELRVEVYQDLMFAADAKSLSANDNDSDYLMFKARDNGVGLVEVARLVGAADPYFTISKAGTITPTTADGFDLGSTSLEWANIYVGSGKLFLGTNQDTNLYKAADNVLKTDDAFQVAGLLSALAGITVTGNILVDGSDTRDIGSTTAEIRNIYVGDAGKVFLGVGQDVNLYRVAADTLWTDDSFGSNGYIRVGTQLLVGSTQNIGIYGATESLTTTEITALVSGALGGVFVVRQDNDNQTALFVISGGASSIVSDPAGGFSSIARVGTTNKIHVYYSIGLASYVVENGYAITKTVSYVNML